MTLHQEIDRGTPARTGAPVTLTIDGISITVPEGTSIMHAASLIERDIPKLCASDNLEAWGSCRMCLVEIEGVRGTPPPAPPRCARAWSSPPRTPNWKNCARA